MTDVCLLILTLCDRTTALDSLYSQILHEPTKLAIIGSGCSPATEPTAEVSHYYNITQLSCQSSSTELRNRVRFPSYFQLESTEETLAFAFYGVIREFGWRRVAMIGQDENLFTVTLDRLTEFFVKDGIEHRQSVFNSIADLNPEPFATDYRIFVFAMFEEFARALLCEAHERNLRFPRYVFLTIGWYNDFWWRVDDEGLNCTIEDRERVLESSLVGLNFFLLDEVLNQNKTTTPGTTGGEYLRREAVFLTEPPLNLTVRQEFAPYCYDAVWTLAYALNETLNNIDVVDVNMELATAFNVTPPFTLEDFSYGNSKLLDIIFSHMANTSFNGLTGPVSFGDQGIRNRTDLIILQFRKITNGSSGDQFLNWVEFGNVFETGENNFTFVYEPGESVETVWPDGVIPFDGIPDKDIVTVHIATTVVFILLASAGILFAVACLIFNFKYRNTKLIRLASSKLNYLIGVGAIILYIDIILFVVPSTDRDVVTVLCNLTPWLTAIGYSLCYGTILVKMLRVYYIFNNTSPNIKPLKDWLLVVWVGCLVAVDLFILITYTAVQGYRKELYAIAVPNSEQEVKTEGEGEFVTEFCAYICDSTPRDIFLGVLYGYKMVLQIIALVLAFSIRKVKVKGLNDAKYIAISVYVTSIALALLILATYTLTDYINGFAALFCTGFFVGTTVILILVFVKLMLGLYKDPTGNNIFKPTDNSIPVNVIAERKSSTSALIDMDALRKRVTELESENNDLKIRLSNSDTTLVSTSDGPFTNQQNTESSEYRSSEIASEL